VSLGSFYWHFKGIGVFQNEVLSLWRQRATLKVIEEVDGLTNASGRLRVSVRCRRSDGMMECLLDVHHR
jgi:hypothetical protein